MQRREFLKTTVVTAGVILMGVGCGGGDSGSTAVYTLDMWYKDNSNYLSSALSSSKSAASQLPPISAYFPQSVASGDPKSDSVVLWTRVYDTSASGDLNVKLEVATDSAFKNIVSIDGATSKTITAKASDDGCVKVKIKSLSAKTYYYYRFSYTAKDGSTNYSNYGRTKTAPAASDDASVKFAYASCQDYNGRYYNSYVKMRDEELDFFVHLGDYVYETTGDPSFQTTKPDRVTKFSDTAGAIVFNKGTSTEYYAAKSLSNYRDLYKTYRGDRALQAVHERFPMIAIWDDHEFTDDCYGDYATYYDGKSSEQSTQRRKDANKAWFEYMPIDTDVISYSDSETFMKIYRDFMFGKNLHLILTDERSYRPDHIIPEDAFPGTVILDKETLSAVLPSVGLTYEAMKSAFGPYIDIDSAAWSAYKPVFVGVMTAQYMAAGLSQTDAATKASSAIKGKISAYVAKQLIDGYNATKPAQSLPQIDDNTYNNTLDRGVAYLHLGKTDIFSGGGMGSRYMVVKDTFDLYTPIRYQATAKASENVLGAVQEAWFLDKFKTSSATWKTWGNEYMNMSMILDLSVQTALPSDLRQKFYLNVDAWDGMPNKRKELINALAAVQNSVIITGDIHSFFAGSIASSSGVKVPEFVGSSISSGTFQSMLYSQIAASPTLKSVSGINSLVASLDDLMKPANTQYVHNNTSSVGYATVECDSKEYKVTFNQIAETEVNTNYLNKTTSELNAKFKQAKFKLTSGSRDITVL